MVFRMKDDLQGYEPEQETVSSYEKGTVKYETILQSVGSQRNSTLLQI